MCQATIFVENVPIKRKKKKFQSKSCSNRYIVKAFFFFFFFCSILMMKIGGITFPDMCQLGVLRQSKEAEYESIFFITRVRVYWVCFLSFLFARKKRMLKFRSHLLLEQFPGISFSLASVLYSLVRPSCSHLVVLSSSKGGGFLLVGSDDHNGQLEEGI